MFQFLEQAQKNQNNPMDILKQVTKNYSPEQKNMLFERAKQFGIPEDVLKQAQDGINAK
jgi:hypothetical protein